MIIGTTSLRLATPWAQRSSTKLGVLALTGLLCSLLFGVGTAVGQQTEATDASPPSVPTVPSFTEGLRSLQIDEDLLADGMAYHLFSGGDAQVAVTVQSRFSRLLATTSRGVGFLVGPFDADELEQGESPIKAGAIRIPTASLRTDSSVDRTLMSEMVFDSANHRSISFVLEDSEVVKRGAGEVADSTRFELKISGTLVFKDKAIPLESTAELTLFLTSNETFSRGTGDFARLTGEFVVDAAQLGLNPRIASRFGAEAVVDYFLVFSTTDPERAIIPPSTPAAYSLGNRYITSLRDLDDAAGAYSAGEELITAAWDDPVALRDFAVSAVFEAGGGRRFLGQARRAAERAVALGGDQPDALAVNVLARIAAETGDLEQAVGLQQRAISLAVGPAARAKSTMESNLQLYQQLLQARAEQNP